MFASSLARKISHNIEVKNPLNVLVCALSYGLSLSIDHNGSLLDGGAFFSVISMTEKRLYQTLTSATFDLEPRPHKLTDYDLWQYGFGSYLAVVVVLLMQ